jgi:glycosyltransferase involved in cell wall biosynthesis
LISCSAGGDKCRDDLESLGVMRILFLSYWYPYPTDNGSKIRILGLLRGLAQKHEVTLLSFADESQVRSMTSELDAVCREVRLVPRKSYKPGEFRALLGLINPTPRYISDTFSTEMASSIKEVLATQEFDLVIASQLGTARYRSYFRHIPAIFEEVELGVYYDRFRDEPSPASRLRNGLTWVKHQRYVIGLLQEYQACSVVTDQERKLIAQTAPEFQAVEVIPNFINLADYSEVSPTPQRNSLIFTGPFRYYANHDAMVWFLKEVYPIIQAQVPEVSLTITGDHADLPLPPAENVRLTGRIEDVRPLLASSWVSLAPLRVGGGSRLKILEAMALGAPVVSTSKGAEGLEVTDGQHLLIGDTAETFAQQVIRLLKDNQVRQEIIERARQRVEETYNWGVVMPRFESLLHRAGNN